MSLKSWVLDRVHRINGVIVRGDLPPREPAFAPSTSSWSRSQTPDSALTEAEHLGPYAALVAAIRDELEHFIVSHVRLHLAIADYDRFVLTSIGVDCPQGGDARALLQQFMREFKPEQVKRYLAREVIGGLPNASAIDLTQFAGLLDARSRDDDADEEDDYAELIESLRAAPPSGSVRPYQVSIVGRWAELDATRANPVTATAVHTTLTTPLAGLRCEFDIEDADGRRRVVLQSVVPGRRYIVGKDEGCDIRVNGSYTSRRHAEIWLDKGAWWVSDAGSTNGIRVEGGTGSIERSGGPENGGAVEQPIKLPDAARIVLSARSHGSASEYPSVALHSPAGTSMRATPTTQIAPTPKTALTPIVATRQAVLTMTARVASGERTLELRAAALPIAIGRSRNQQLIVDRIHEAVSGHHLEIIELDESGAQVVVHGDNGVVVDGVSHAVGTQFRWNIGQTMVLGAGLKSHPPCSLVLSRP